MAVPALPARTGRWWARTVLVVLGVTALTAAVLLVQRRVGATPVAGDRLGFELLDDASVRLQFEVRRDDPARPAVCIVRARSLDGDEAGRKEVFVPPSAGSLVLSTVVRTSKPPVTAEVHACSLDVPAWLTGPEPPGP